MTDSGGICGLARALSWCHTVLDSRGWKGDHSPSDSDDWTWRGLTLQQLHTEGMVLVVVPRIAGDTVSARRPAGHSLPAYPLLFPSHNSPSRPISEFPRPICIAAIADARGFQHLPPNAPV